MKSKNICLFSKNGGTCVLLDNNQRKIIFKINIFLKILFLAQCLCTAVFRGITCNQFSYIPCGDATCHITQVIQINFNCETKKT